MKNMISLAFMSQIDAVWAIHWRTGNLTVQCHCRTTLSGLRAAYVLGWEILRIGSAPWSMISSATDF